MKFHDECWRPCVTFGFAIARIARKKHKSVKCIFYLTAFDVPTAKRLDPFFASG